MLSRLARPSSLMKSGRNLCKRLGVVNFTTGGTNTITVTDNRNGKSIEIPITDNNIRATDLKQLGLQSYDPGYMNTTCCISKISFIDGANGILRYRGMPIETLAEKSSFTESSFLLFYGDLPTQAELKEFEKNLMIHSNLHSDLIRLHESFRHDAHPMGMFISALSAMGTIYPEQNPALTNQNIYRDPAVRNKQIMRILGSSTTLAATAHRMRMGKNPVEPNQDLGFVENFLYMMDVSHEGKDFRPHPALVKALDVLFLIHAEHELNCSTAAMRHLTSSNVDVYTAASAAVGALYGPRHGGANEAVLRMLDKIGSADNVESFVQKVKSRDEMLMGFGHRVYKNYDPRARIVRQLADEVFNVLGREDLIEVAMKLEEIALNDEFFVKRKLYPNVDFYSGLIYKAMGFPTDMFPILFAIPRLTGWLSHWQEWIEDPENRIYRPFQIYKGHDVREYSEIAGRASSVEAAQLEVKHSAFGRRRDAALGQVHPADNYNWQRD